MPEVLYIKIIINIPNEIYNSEENEIEKIISECDESLATYVSSDIFITYIEDDND